jgi:hypothetical protein
MNARSFFAISLSLNALLMSVWLIRWHSAVSTPTVLNPISVNTTVAATQTPVQELSAAPAATFGWSLIESKDYGRYLANLRAAECPEWLARDIIVADINAFYQSKFESVSNYFPPWQSANRRAAAHAASQKKYDLQMEKRALVRQLFGYDWDDYDSKVWAQDLTASLLLGFLPDEKASQIVALAEKYSDAASQVREDANGILIDEDRRKLQALYDNLLTEAIPLLDAAEMDELQLRVQASLFFADHDVHFDGLSLTDWELRQIARFSKSVDDAMKNEFVAAPPLSAEERERRQIVFDGQVKNLLGAQRFADFQLAQDFNFRDTFEFAEKIHLPKDAAIKTYEVRVAAEDQFNEVLSDKSLSPAQQTAALANLKTATAGAVSSLLGDFYSDYVQGPGWWLENFSDQQKN